MQNKIDYFKDLKTVEEIKATFRKLAFKNHPDQGGDEAIMKDINNQYQEALARCDGQKNNDGHIYTYKEDIEKELMQKIMDLQSFKGLTIALIGYWIWVSGETKPIKDQLKEQGLLWHSQRKCWYYKPKGWKHKKRSNVDLSELAQKYGYKGFHSNDTDKVPALT